MSDKSFYENLAMECMFGNGDPEKVIKPVIENKKPVEVSRTDDSLKDSILQNVFGRSVSEQVKKEDEVSIVVPENIDDIKKEADDDCFRMLKNLLN